MLFGEAKRTRGLPRYSRIATHLRAELESGEWEVGARLPSIETLAKTFGVAPLTVRQALIVLEEENLVECRQGYGTVVTADGRNFRWLELPTNWSALIKNGEQLNVARLLEETPEQMPSGVPRHTRLAPAYHRLKRVHAKDGEPFCAVDVHVSSALFESAPQRFRTHILINLIDKMPDVSIAGVRQQLRVDIANTETAELLRIPLGAAIASVRRTMWDDDGIVLYHANLSYRGDVIFLEIDMAPE